ncbi:PH domain-containing protein [Nocardioides oleivorans]|uniref:PH domain-containing protein n=1 Tax=Nocardioides oleivorans TaxID=273676 RepID=UPI0013EDF131|nr:PH domain-containing protein [Nocardioides oleivorans]
MIAAPGEPGEGWSRLSPRKLLLDPVKAVGQSIVPVVVALVGISQNPRYWPIILPIAIIGPVLFGVLPWLTTHYRLTETQIQVRKGILNKQTSTAPLDRVRSVDLEASLLHRVLGVQKVQVGTGVDDDRITLDALAAADAQALRTTLLHRRAVAAPAEEAQGHDAGQDGIVATAAPAEPAPTVLARIDWSWLRFAPFSLGRLVIVAGAVGLFSQFADNLPIWNQDTATSAWQWITQFALVLVAVVLLVGALVGWLVISVGGYVVQWWNFLLVREHGSLHLTSGLFTRRSITVEEAKVRGVELTEPVLMRGVGGAELATLATGVEDGVTTVLPPCPRGVAIRVGETVLDHAGPLTEPLVEHGPRAHRRAWFRQVRNCLDVVVVAAVAWWFLDFSIWWVVALAVAAVLLGAAAGEASYRHLGHRLSGDHLVAGSGVLARIRTVLETDGIIGWVVTQSWWQRRIGLADLTATTAAGKERVLVRDVRLDVAVALADSSTPGLLTDFLAPGVPASS